MERNLPRQQSWSMGKIILVVQKPPLYERWFFRLEAPNFNQFPLLKKLKEWDYYTYFHSVHVYHLSLLLGIRANYSGQDLRHLGYGALLHDVGKLAVPQSILTKPGPLTTEEMAEIKKHPEAGYSMITELIILQHHESWDGGGYPQGLQKDNIHPFSQIVSVADVYDALVSKRVYAGSRTNEEALRYISELSGRKFNPELVKLFCWTKTTKG